MTRLSRRALHESTACVMAASCRTAYKVERATDGLAAHGIRNVGSRGAVFGTTYDVVYGKTWQATFVATDRALLTTARRATDGS